MNICLLKKRDITKHCSTFWNRNSLSSDCGYCLLQFSKIRRSFGGKYFRLLLAGLFLLEAVRLTETSAEFHRNKLRFIPEST